VKYGKLIGLLLAFWYFLYYSSHTATWHYIDGLDLLIHEAGHVIFIFFGEFMHILGGSLFQLVFPMIFVVYFILRQEYFSASALLLWPAVNLLNIAIYAGDAVFMQLPLLGGDNVIHDWNALLTMTGLLDHAGLISLIIWDIGMVLGLSSAVLGFYFWYKENTREPLIIADEIN
jgi:hypothetical protein